MIEFLIEKFYLFFQGIMLFQCASFAMIYFINKRKDVLLYFLMIFFASLYFFLNATNTFFNIDEDLVFSKPYYVYLNYALLLAMILLYLLFIHEMFVEEFHRPYLQKLYKITLSAIPLLYIVFCLCSYFNWPTDIIFYLGHIINGPVIFIIIYHNFFSKGFKSLIINGMLIITVYLFITIYLIVRYNVEQNPHAFDKYPLFFIRVGMLIDMFLFQLALLKRWNEQEKELITKDFETKLAVEKVRNQISQELHDDVGANLSSINFLIEMLKSNTEKKGILERITANITETSTLLNDTIWAMNPNFDSLKNVFDRIINFSNSLFATKDIAFTYSIEKLEEIPIFEISQRRKLYLTLKEAINNIAKHSNATKVNLIIGLRNNDLEISIEDNGVGFDERQTALGNGLKNFKLRNEEPDFRVSVESEIGQGTKVLLKIPFKNHQYM